MLAKSQVDPEKIEEAIARLILEHNEDEEAHLGPGQSLQSHKAAEIIDHLIASIVADKIKDFEVIPKKIAAAFSFTHDWNSLDGWEQGNGGGDGYASPEVSMVYLNSGNVANKFIGIRTGAYVPWAVSESKLFTVEFTIGFIFENALTNCIAYLIATHWSDFPFLEIARHLGFKILNGSIYASHGNTFKQTLTDTGVDIASGLQFTRLRCEFLPYMYIKFYINDELKVTHTEDLPDYMGWGHLFFQLKTSENAVKEICIGRSLVERFK